MNTLNYIKSIIVYRSDYAARVSIFFFPAGKYFSRLIANLNIVLGRS